MAGFTLGNMWDFNQSKATKKKAGLRKSEYSRDELSKEDDHVVYRVWGNEIARLNPKKNTLRVTDANYRSKLTKDRLNTVLPHQAKVTQKKKEWYYTNEKHERITKFEPMEFDLHHFQV
jgi:hypothetical protein